MFQRFYAVGLNTFVETIRQPIYGVILMATAVLLILNVSLAAFTLDDDDKLLLDLGLSTLLLGGLFLSAFSAAGILSREIENKTVLTVISKPVGRPTFVLAKFAGLLAAIFVALYLGTLVFVLSVRHGVLESTADPWDGPVLALGFGSVGISLVVAAFCNYSYGRDFPTMVIGLLTPLLTLSVVAVGKLDEHWNVIPFGSNYFGGQIVLAAFLVVLIVMITTAVALAASTRFGQLMTLVICTGVLCLGIVSDHAFGQSAQSSVVAGFAYHVIPNVGIFWVIDGLHAATEKTTVPFAYIGYATSYALLLTAGILAIAVFAFQRREVG